ncbi:Flagellar attachment zone protein 1 [Diplonema papillatum]|nr:Flagellar attachment zone protein 1 [Diplonema papillatum]KAJ9464702.1 Flagellar attachment zone protein 1 [Diplonema papillatum]
MAAHVFECGQRVVLGQLTALARHNGKTAVVVEESDDGKLKVELEGEMTLVKVNKRNCEPLRAGSKSRSASPAGSSWFASGAQYPSEFADSAFNLNINHHSRVRERDLYSTTDDVFSPAARPRPYTHTRSSSPRSTTGGHGLLYHHDTPADGGALTLEGESDFKDFSKLLAEVTNRETAFTSHCSMLQSGFEKKQLELKSAALREHAELVKQNRELQLAVQQLKGKLRSAEAKGQTTDYSLAQKISDEVERKLRPALEKQRQIDAEEATHRLKVALQERSLQLEAEKKAEWQQLQRDFEQQLGSLSATYEARVEDEKLLLHSHYAKDIDALKSATEAETQKRIDTVRREFEVLFKKRLEAVEARTAGLVQSHEDELQELQKRLEDEKAAEVEAMRLREEERMHELQIESQVLMRKMRDKEALGQDRERERAAEEAAWEDRVKQTKALHEEETAKYSSVIDVLQRELTDTRSEVAVMRVRLKEADARRGDKTESERTRQAQKESRWIDEEVLRVKEELRRGFAAEVDQIRRAHDQEKEELCAAHRRELGMLEAKEISRSTHAQKERDAAVDDARSLSHALNVARGTQDASLAVSARHSLSRRSAGGGPGRRPGHPLPPAGGGNDPVFDPHAAASPPRGFAADGGEFWANPSGPLASPSSLSQLRQASSLFAGPGLSRPASLTSSARPPVSPDKPEQQAAAAAAPVVLFEGMNFKGKSVAVGFGTHNVADVAVRAIASARVPAGFCVVFHERENGEGATRRINADCMFISDYNKRSSSITIARAVG